MLEFVLLESSTSLSATWTPIPNASLCALLSNLRISLFIYFTQFRHNSSFTEGQLLTKDKLLMARKVIWSAKLHFKFLISWRGIQLTPHQSHHACQKSWISENRVFLFISKLRKRMPTFTGEIVSSFFCMFINRLVGFVRV